MATYPSAQFGVGGYDYGGGAVSTSQAPYTADVDASGDAPWYQVLADAGLSIFDQVTYTAQERARDSYTADAQQSAIDAQVELGAINAQQQSLNQRTTMIVVGAVGAVVALAFVMR